MQELEKCIVGAIDEVLSEHNGNSCIWNDSDNVYRLLCEQLFDSVFSYDDIDSVIGDYGISEVIERLHSWEYLADVTYTTSFELLNALFEAHIRELVDLGYRSRGDWVSVAETLRSGSLFDLGAEK